MKNYFTVYDGTEIYRINENAEIARQCMDYKPSKQWKAASLVRYYNNGGFKERIPFVNWLSNIKHIQDTMHFKNGKAQWYLSDIDHGTYREWGKPIQSLRFVKELEHA